MHPRPKDRIRAQQSPFDAPEASDDDRECTRSHLSSIRRNKACVCAQSMHPRSGQRLGCSHGPGRRMRVNKVALVKYPSEPSTHIASYHVKQIMLPGLRRERECMRSRLQCIKSKPSMRMRTKHASALRTAPGLLPGLLRAVACIPSRILSTNHAFAVRTAPGLLSGVRRRTRVHENHALQVSGDPSMHSQPGQHLGCSQGLKTT